MEFGGASVPNPEWAATPERFDRLYAELEGGRAYRTPEEVLGALGPRCAGRHLQQHRTLLAVELHRCRESVFGREPCRPVAPSGKSRRRARGRLVIRESDLSRQP